MSNPSHPSVPLRFARAAGRVSVVFLIGSLLVFGILLIDVLPHRNPTHAVWGGESYTLRYLDTAEAVVIDLVRDSDDNVRYSLAGSTDLMCDPPVLVLFDTDANGTNDLYIHECGGHGVLHFDPVRNEFVFEDLGQYGPDDLAALDSFRFREIRNGGPRTILIGCILAAAALACVFIAGVARLFAPARSD